MDENIIIGIDIDRKTGLAQVKSFAAQAAGTTVAMPLKLNDAAAFGQLKKFVAAGGKPLVMSVNVTGTNSVTTATKALTGFNQQTNSASYALLNINRVIQDTPYGFMGISNNLNPMVEGFQKLARETGSTSLAFRALGATLIGPGGLALAVSVLSAALSFGAIGLQMWGRRGKEAKEATDGAKDAAKAMAAEMADNMVKLTALVGITQNHNASLRDKELAIQKLNEEYGPMLTNLGLEQISLKNVTAAYDKLIDTMIRQAVVKGLQEQISKNVEKTAASLVTLEQAEQKRAAASQAAADKMKNQETVMDKLVRTSQYYNGVRNDGYLAQVRQNQAVVAGNEAEFNYDARKKKMVETLKGELKPLMDLTDKYSDLNQTLNKGAGAHKATGKAAGDANKEFEKLIKTLDEARANRTFDLMGQRAAIGLHDQLKQWRDELPASTEDFKLKAKLFPEVEFLDRTPSWLSAYIKKNQKDLDQARRETEMQMQAFSAIVQNAAVEGFAAIGTGIGNAIAGLEGLGGIFSRVGIVLGNAMVDFGKQMIMGSSVVAAAKKALESLLANPYAGIVAGVALVAAGTAIKAALQKKAQGTKLTGFADGGMVSGPMMGLVGEGRRTSRNNPEVMAPLDRLKDFFAGMMADFTARNRSTQYYQPAPAVASGGDVHFSISGDTLVGVLRRAEARQRRNY